MSFEMAQLHGFSNNPDALGLLAAKRRKNAAHGASRAERGSIQSEAHLRLRICIFPIFSHNKAAG